MTQLEVPQISLQRYLELLKRRRWQVVPASLLGLLLGGVVAFFIPRYYVAKTLLVHQMAPGMEAVRSKDDPFRTIVETARITLPLAVGETIRVLGWPEASEPDPYLRSEIEEEIRDRLSVDDVNKSEDRDYAQISVGYRDLDGQRSAHFLNTLVPIWIKQRLEELRVQQERVRADAAKQYARINGAYEQLLGDKRYLEVQYSIDPSLDVALQREEQRRRTDAQHERQQLLAQAKVDLGAAEQLRDQAIAQLAVTEKRRPVDVNSIPEDSDPLLQQQLLALKEKLRYWQQAADNFLPTTRQHRDAKLELARVEEQMKALRTPVAGDGTEPNPEHARLMQEVASQEAAVARLSATTKNLQLAVEQDEKRLLSFTEGYEQYERKLALLEDARKQRETANALLVDADTTLAMLQNQRTVRQVTEALVPPRPTDPNILVVALIGCVLGLAFAIALILLLDVLRGSFKTLEEVERGLSVPVLGGMSFLETQAQREATMRRRRRVSVVAAALLFLSVSVVTLYYVDPTRLPPVVRDFLAILLGA